ncbi:DNA-processing protein DprA [Patulibacter minatonensis]|uniref:DNA-processing protein DprA n=1 Tax=Patulibacter minatonensis TaxID=298163 RepID=UPI0004B59E92|nr:DNA-processing protein DprA [Patulibacter minatonensis]
MRACADCVRRAQLLREMTPGLDRPRAGRPPLVLALENEDFVRAVQGDGAPRPRALRCSDDELLSGAAGEERAFGVESVCRHDDAFPGRLRELRDPPAVLHVLGGVERLLAVLGPGLDRPTIAMVGARRAPADGRRLARRFAESLAGGGITVVSGMAFGIDEASHEGALAAGAPTGDDHAGPGGTVAVLASGPERATPATLRGLYGRIAEHGVIVSELPPGSTPRRWSFPARNRLIAALGDGLLVTAAARGSGSLRSVEHANGLHRPVGVVPGSVLDPAWAGSNDLLRGVVSGDDDDPGPARAIVTADDARQMVHEALVGVRSVRRGASSGGGGPVQLPLGQEEPPSAPRVVPPTLGVPLPEVDRLLGLHGNARRIGEQLLRGPRTIESLIAEDGATTVLAGLGALEADGRLRRSLDGGLELLAERPDAGPND